MTIKTVTFPEKLTISTKEASEWSGIGINRLRDIMNDESCPFVIYIGTKKRVKVEKFKEWFDYTYSA